MTSVSSCQFYLLSGILLFQSKGLPLEVPVGDICYSNTFLVFLLWEWFNFYFILKGQLCRLCSSWLTVRFFQCFEDVISFSAFRPPWFLGRNKLLIFLKIPLSGWIPCLSWTSRFFLCLSLWHFVCVMSRLESLLVYSACSLLRSLDIN